MTKNFTIYSDNPKMNTAPVPTQPKGQVIGGMVCMIELPPTTVTESLVREAAYAKREQDAMKPRKKSGV